MKHYELNLPENYKVDKVIDAKNGKTALFMNLACLGISIVLVAIGMILYSLKYEIEFNNKGIFIPLILYFVSFVIIIVTHELIHGLFYKIFTKQKLTFGVSISAAFCGVPNIYVRKKAMIITCIAPCVILSLLLLIPLFLISDTVYFILVLLVFAFHFGGCCGDLYCIIMFIFKYKNKDILVNDTGLKQTIYVKTDA